ncbi:hypothetical protein DL93DRAFT_2166862 [Clavulina sp. PMI_390]|nr:hypothetical protein DL93DRAFT_2166862 [Clavulina sp. PMI_390]
MSAAPLPTNTMRLHNAVQVTRQMAIAWTEPRGYMAGGQQYWSIDLIVSLPNGNQLFYTGHGGKVGHAKDQASSQVLQAFFPGF